MIEILMDEVTEEGMRHVKVVSDAPLSAPFGFAAFPQLPTSTEIGGSVKCWDDEMLDLHYLEAEYPMRGFVDVHFEGMSKFRRLVLYKFTKRERVSEIVSYVADWFFVQTGHRPQYAFLRELPRGAENGMEVDGVMVMQAEWALSGCVMVGG